MDSIQKLETQLARLQNDIALLEKRINLADAEQKVTSVTNKSELKKNSLEMKQLRMQVEELQVRLKRQQLTDYKLMKDALHEKYKNAEELEGQSPQEMLQLVESRVIDLANKCQKSSRELQTLKRIQTENENSLKELTDSCSDDRIPTEAQCIQHIRNLENEHHKTIKNIEECEKEKNKLKSILEMAKRKQKSHFRLFMDLKKERMKQANNEDEDVKEKKKKSENNDQEEKETEFERLQKDISLLKDVTGCYHAKDLDSAFLEQKLLKEDLTEMEAKAEKQLKELEAAKKELALKRALMKEADCVYPKIDTLSLARSRQKEQEIRHESAETELQRLNSLSDQTRNTFQRLITKMQPKVNKEELRNKDIRQLTKLFEKTLMHALPPKQHTRTRNTKKSTH